jgi:hypothetical protein
VAAGYDLMGAAHKRQGTPSLVGGEMSHYVAGVDSLRIESKGLVEVNGRFSASKVEESAAQAQSK